MEHDSESETDALEVELVLLRDDVLPKGHFSAECAASLADVYRSPDDGTLMVQDEEQKRAILAHQRCELCRDEIRAVLEILDAWERDPEKMHPNP